MDPVVGWCCKTSQNQDGNILQWEHVTFTHGQDCFVAPSISITKSPKNATFDVGGPFRFKIVGSSNGPGTAYNVELNDPLPTTAGLTWTVTSVTSPGTCTINASQILNCSFGDMAEGTSMTVKVTTNNSGGAP